MSKPIPEAARAQIRNAADRAYEEIRWEVGDSYEVARVLHRLAYESWREGYRAAQSAPEAE